jgi:hypothetical protein
MSGATQSKTKRPFRQETLLLDEATKRDVMETLGPRSSLLLLFVALGLGSLLLLLAIGRKSVRGRLEVSTLRLEASASRLESVRVWFTDWDVVDWTAFVWNFPCHSLHVAFVVIFPFIATPCPAKLLGREWLPARHRVRAARM